MSEITFAQLMHESKNFSLSFHFFSSLQLIKQQIVGASSISLINKMQKR